MEFYEFTSFHDILRRAGDEDTPARQYRRAAAVAYTKVMTDDNDNWRSEFNRCNSERFWYENGNPYFKVHPGVLPMLMNVGIEIPVEKLVLPFTSFLIRLPKEDNPLIISENLRVQSMLVTESMAEDQDRRIFIWIDTGEVSGELGYPVLSYSQLQCKDGMSIEEAFNYLPRDPTDLSPEQTEQILRLAVSVAFLATGSDKLISPDVLGKDVSAWLAAMRSKDESRRRVIEARAVRRGKHGWHVGYGERILVRAPAGQYGDGSGHELSYQHQRSAHFRELQSGKVIFIRQATVRADLPPRNPR